MLYINIIKNDKETDPRELSFPPGTLGLTPVLTVLTPLLHLRILPIEPLQGLYNTPQVSIPCTPWGYPLPWYPMGQTLSQYPWSNLSTSHY